jgi:hypothetical protein
MRWIKELIAWLKLDAEPHDRLYIGVTGWEYDYD